MMGLAPPISPDSRVAAGAFGFLTFTQSTVAYNRVGRTTSIAGMRVSNWILVIVAVVVLWIIYSASIHRNKQPHNQFMTA
jgi:hypothetical protein